MNTQVFIGIYPGAGQNAILWPTTPAWEEQKHKLILIP